MGNLHVCFDILKLFVIKFRSSIGQAYGVECLVQHREVGPHLQAALYVCVSAIKLGKLKDEIEEISCDGTTQRLRELDQRRLIKLHERVADTAVFVECYQLALHHYYSMVRTAIIVIIITMKVPLLP